MHTLTLIKININKHLIDIDSNLSWYSWCRNNKLDLHSSLHCSISWLRCLINCIVCKWISVGSRSLLRSLSRCLPIIICHPILSSLLRLCLREKIGRILRRENVGWGLPSQGGHQLLGRSPAHCRRGLLRHSFGHSLGHCLRHSLGHRFGFSLTVFVPVVV